MSQFNKGDVVRIIADRNGPPLGTRARVTKTFEWWVHLIVEPINPATRIDKPFTQYIYRDDEIEALK